MPPIRQSSLTPPGPIPLFLQPFIYQVDGNLPILKYDWTNICKIVSDSDRKFLRNIPGALKPFVTWEKGQIDVTFYKDKKDVLQFISIIPEELNTPITIRENKEIPEVVIKFDRKTNGLKLSGFMPLFRFVDDNDEYEIPFHPALNTIYNECIDGIMFSLNKAVRYTIYEDLCSKFRYPSILSLRLRNCEYQMMAAERYHLTKNGRFKKAKEAKEVVAKGLQVYNVSQQMFIGPINRYGKMLPLSELRKVLLNFLNNGDILRLDALQAFKERLEILIRSLHTVKGVRFQNVTLLFIYEGHMNPLSTGVSYKELPQWSAPQGGNLIDVRLLDFDDCLTAPPSAPESATPDFPLIKELKGIIRQFEALVTEKCVTNEGK